MYLIEVTLSACRHNRMAEKEASRLEKEHVHKVYERIAPYFNDKRYKAWPRVQEFLLAQETGSLIADIGCGNGKYLNINSEVYKVGCDCCIPLAAAARNQGFEVMVCDGLRLPYQTGCFDIVLSVAVIHHFSTKERRIRAIKEMSRILKVGGQLMIYVWAMEQETRKFEKQDVFIPFYLESTSARVSSKKQDAFIPFYLESKSARTSSKKFTQSVTPICSNFPSNRHLNNVTSTLKNQRTKGSSLEEKEACEYSFEKLFQTKFLSHSLDSGLNDNSKYGSTGQKCERLLTKCCGYCTQSNRSSCHSLYEKPSHNVFLRLVGGFFSKYMKSIKSDTFNMNDKTILPSFSTYPDKVPYCSKIITDFKKCALPDCNGKANEMYLSIKHTDLHEAETDTSENSNHSSTSGVQHHLTQSVNGTCLRYYHIFKKGELNELIEQYIPELQVVETYFDHSNWCVIAKKKI